MDEKYWRQMFWRERRKRRTDRYLMYMQSIALLGMCIYVWLIYFGLIAV